MFCRVSLTNLFLSIFVVNPGLSDASGRGPSVASTGHACITADAGTQQVKCSTRNVATKCTYILWIHTARSFGGLSCCMCSVAGDGVYDASTREIYSKIMHSIRARTRSWLIQTHTRCDRSGSSYRISPYD